MHSTGKGTWREYDLLDEPESGPCEIRISSKSEDEIAESPANTEFFQGAKIQHLGFPTVGIPDSGIPAVGISEVGISNTEDESENNTYGVSEEQEYYSMVAEDEEKYNT